MAIFVATFAAVAVTAAQDVFEIVAPASSRLLIREIRLGQYSDPGDAQAEMLSVQIIRGYTTSGSGGSAVTPVNFSPVSGAASPVATVERNNTTVAQDGTGAVLLADTFNVMGGWRYYPVPEERIEVGVSQRLVVRITAPADSLTMNGTMVYEEVGKVPVS
jgi:hypothetical protein